MPTVWPPILKKSESRSLFTAHFTANCPRKTIFKSFEQFLTHLTDSFYSNAHAKVKKGFSMFSSQKIGSSLDHDFWSSTI